MTDGWCDTNPPSVTFTDATPKNTSNQALGGMSTPTSALVSTSGSIAKGTDASYRLLYRGALSLPDSYLQLDGLAFSALLSKPNVPESASYDSPSSGVRELMNNPLALALESMRGRQTLRFKGAVQLRDVWVDDVGDVYMDIHPFATLSRIYFENILCLSPLVASPHVSSGCKRTEVGVRVSLGDTDGPETTDIVIYGETSTRLHPPPLPLSSARMSMSAGPPPLSVRVARIRSAPRAPRPDDPTPRKPPTRLFAGTTVRDLGANKRIVARPARQDKGKHRGEDPVLRRAQEIMLHLPRSEVPANGGFKAKDEGTDNPTFKVPELPVKARRKQGQGDTGSDVFGAVGPPRPPSVSGKGKGKAGDHVVEEEETGNAIEAANKLMIKKSAVHRLADAGVPRSHPEFKDVFGFVYRGATFALRSQAKTTHLSPQAVEAAVVAHVKMYVLTSGGDYDTTGPRESGSLTNNMDFDA